MFSIKRSVKLGDTDAAGRLYFLSPLNWCQETFEEFLLEKNYSLKNMLDGEYQTPVVRVECDFKHSAVVGDSVKIDIQTIQINNSSFCVKYGIQINENTLASAKITHVCVESNTGKSITLPDEFKKILINS